MDRRQFLRVGAGTVAAKTILSQHPGATTRLIAAETRPPLMPSVLSTFTADDHRRRLQNIKACESGIRKCMRKHLVTGYLPGQCIYNLCEYPSLEPWQPNDYDEQELDRLRNHGIGLIQLHNEWADWLGLFGGNHFVPQNPAGFRRFVDMVHKRGMKLIAYISTAYFSRRDPAFCEPWSRRQTWRGAYFDLAVCSAASAGWRAYLLPQLVRLLDDYGIDGLYNDRDIARNDRPPTADEVRPFAEGAADEAVTADLLAMIYAEVKRRGGIVKLHTGGATGPQTNLPVYDYLWVGELVRKVDDLRNATKNLTPYVVPCLDFATGTKVEREEELYLHAVPYMQFPLLMAGRPFTGERGFVPGIKYYSEYRNLRQIREHYQAHPEGPHGYGWWDSVPGRPEARPAHARWLRRYLPMVEEGTWAYLDIGDSDMFAGPLPTDVVASAFANRELHLVLANYGRQPAEIVTSRMFVPSAEPASAPGNRWSLEGRSLRILRAVVSHETA